MTPQNVVIIDDQADFANHLAEVLSESGYRPQVFLSATAGLEHLKTTREGPDLVLVDVHMPDMTGVQLIATLSLSRELPPIIVMTAHMSLHTAIECLRIGADDYITKPLDLDLLILTMDRVRERRLLRQRNIELSLRLAERSHGHRRSQAVLNRLTQALRYGPQIPDFSGTAQEILLLTHELVESSVSSLRIRHGRGETLTLHVPQDNVTPLMREQIESLLAWAAVTGQTVLNGAPMSETESITSNYFREYPSCIFLPIFGKTGVLGALQVSRAKGRALFAAEEIQVLELVAAEAAILQQNASLSRNYEKMTIGAMASLAKALNYKDSGTDDHARRTSNYLRRTLDAFGIGEDEAEVISFAMRLHDIGKIKVPNHILNKPAALSDDEWAVMRMHPVWGFDILNSEGLLSDVALLVRHHHERYDGSGYPDGLKGESIPFGARVIAVVDAYDAMRSNRPYRKCLSADHAIKEIETNLATQFDPQIGAAFVEAVKRENVSIAPV